MESSKKEEKKKEKKDKKGLDNTGFIDTLTESQAAILAEFKAHLKAKELGQHPRYDDVYLLRFLRARQFNFEKTVLMFTNFLKWREENRIDYILEEFKFEEERQVQEAYSHFYHKTDKLGRSVYYERLGLMQVDKLFQHTTDERMVKHVCQTNEITIGLRFPVCSLLNGKRTDQGLAIMDLQGFKMSMMNKRVYYLIKLAAGISQDYYPEILGNMLVVNAPALFTGVWVICKGFVDEKTRQKIKIVKKEKTLKEMTKYIDLDDIPQFLGGNCTCEGLGGCLFSNAGPWNDYEMIQPVGIKKKECLTGPSSIKECSSDENVKITT